MVVESWPFNSIPEMRSFRLRSFNVSAVGSQNREYIPGGLMVARWEAKLSFADMNEEKWREHDGLIARLRGASGLLRLWDAARPEPFYNQAVTKSVTPWDGGTTFTDAPGFEEGALPPFVAVDAAAARADNNLVLSQFPASKTAVLRSGDLVEFRPNGIAVPHGHLHVVTRSANSNPDGKARVYFEPGLRGALVAGDMCVLGGGDLRPTTVFRLASDEEGLIDVRAPNIGSLGLSFIEVLPRS